MLLIKIELVKSDGIWKCLEKIERNKGAIKDS